MAKRPEQSLDVLGQSLLSQQAATRSKADKRRRKDQKRMMALGALVAGQSLVSSALERRVKEIKENNTLDMQNARLYHKQIQKTAQLYDTFEGHDFKDVDAAYGSKEFMDKFDLVYTPMFDKQMEKHYGKVDWSPTERNDLYLNHQKELLTNLLNNRDAWRKGITDFGKTNKELTLGTEADLNIHLTKLAKEQSRNLGGSVFSGPNLKALFSVGFRREGSVFDKTLTEQSPLKGLQGTINTLGLDNSFSQSVTSMRTSGRNWLNIGENDTETQALMESDLSLIESRLRKGDPLLKNNPRLRPFEEDKLPNYNKRREQIAGGVRMGEFVGWLNDEDNAFVRKQFTEQSTALYLKLKNERGFKEELLQTIGYEPGSKEFNELKSVLNNDAELRTFANATLIDMSVTDHSGETRNKWENEYDFSFDPTKIKHLIVNKIEVTRDGFNTTDDFDKSSIEERDNAIVDEGKRILESGLDPAKKSEVTEKLLEDVGDQTSTSKNELRERIKFVNVTTPSVNQEYISKEWQDKLERSAGDEFWSPILWGAGNIASLQKYAEKGIKDSNLSFALSRHNLSDDASSQDVQKYLSTYLES
tara:strand:+ start:4190 stop:5956 length:1767 start_codon:yes stop_codon:yes gene_type:complete